MIHGIDQLPAVQTPFAYREQYFPEIGSVLPTEKEHLPAGALPLVDSRPLDSSFRLWRSNRRQVISTGACRFRSISAARRMVGERWLTEVDADVFPSRTDIARQARTEMGTL